MRVYTIAPSFVMRLRQPDPASPRHFGAGMVSWRAEHRYDRQISCAGQSRFDQHCDSQWRSSQIHGRYTILCQSGFMVGLQTAPSTNADTNKSPHRVLSSRTSSGCLAGPPAPRAPEDSDSLSHQLVASARAPEPVRKILEIRRSAAKEGGSIRGRRKKRSKYLGMNSTCQPDHEPCCCLGEVHRTCLSLPC